MHRFVLALSFVAIAATTGAAQTSGASGAPGTIDPGMTRAQVIEKLGKPATIRNYQGSTYLMYTNKCGKACGMQDIVILDHDVVVDAVFRSPDRHYTGTSSSPEATKPNSRSQRNQPLNVTPAAPTGAAPPVVPSMTHAPADSSTSSMSRPPADSATSSMSHPPTDTVPLPQAPAPQSTPPK